MGGQPKPGMGGQMTKPGMGGQPPMAQPQKPVYDPRAYLNAVQQYKQSGSQGRQPLYTDFQKQQPGNEVLSLNKQLQAAGKPGMLGYSPEQMRQQLGGQPGGMDPMQRYRDLLGGMGGQMAPGQQPGMGGQQVVDPRMQQPGMGGGMGGGMDDAYQQFLAEQRQTQQQSDMYNSAMRTASMNMLPQYGGDQSNPAYQAAMQAQDAQMRTQMGIQQAPMAQLQQPQQGGYGPGISNYSAPQQSQQLGSQPPAARRPMADYRQLLGQTPWTGGSFNPQGQQQTMLGHPPLQQRQPMAQPYTPNANQIKPANPMAQPKPLSQPPVAQSQAMGMNMGGSVGMTPPNPYSQQVGQEDPRMQAMRNMQMMNFGG